MNLVCLSSLAHKVGEEEEEEEEEEGWGEEEIEVRQKGWFAFSSIRIFSSLFSET